MKRKAFAFALLLAVSSLLWGQGHDNIYGKYNQFNTPRSLGLGGAGLASEAGPGAVFMNPALMSYQLSNLSVRFMIDTRGNQEERSLRVFDSFDSYLTDEIYAMQQNTYNNLNFSAVYPLPLLEKYQPALGIGYSRAWDFNYNYEEQLRNPDPFNQENRDVLYGYNILDSQGDIHQIPIQISLMPFERFFVSAGITVFTGSVEQKKYINAVESNNPPFSDSTLYNNNYELDGLPVAINFSMAQMLSKRLTYALRFDSPYTLNFTHGYYYEVPMRIGLGIDYRARNMLMARFNFDVDYRSWSKIKQKWSWGTEGETDGNPGWRDTWTFKVGIEHFFHEDFPFRLGFNYNMLPQQKDQNAYLITAGTGLTKGPFEFDFSGGIGSRHYIHSDLFPNSLDGAPDRTGDNALDKVKDIYYELIVAVTYNF